MHWLEAIKKYTPYNIQEIKDKETTLKYVNKFDDLLTRENVFAHMTASAFAVNKEHNKLLMIHHNIYNTWAWTGGHADGMEDMLEVAIKELKEETGIRNIYKIYNDIISLDIIPVYGHMKKGQYISAHQHINLTYLIECSEKDILSINHDENSGVKWIHFNDISKYSNEYFLLHIMNK